MLTSAVSANRKEDIMCIATVKSTTAAQIAQRALFREGISAEIVSVDPAITERGCTVGIAFSCTDVTKVERIMGRSGIAVGGFIGNGK